MDALALLRRCLQFLIDLRAGRPVSSEVTALMADLENFIGSNE